MNTKRKAIVLDMDETLEHGFNKHMYNNAYGLTMILRPHLDELIKKLKEVKSTDTDIFLFTLAKDVWIERLLKLKPEFKELFSDIFSRDNQDKWPQYSPSNLVWRYPLKPITELNHDAVLFIDDDKKCLTNELEYLYHDQYSKKDTTYFSGFGFGGGDINFVYSLLDYANYPQINQLLKEYIKLENDDPGCLMMCDAVDKFMSKEYYPGLTLADSQYSKQYYEYKNKKDEFQFKSAKLIHDVFEQARKEGKDIKTTDVHRKAKITRNYLSKDRKYPFEGLEYTTLVVGHNKDKSNSKKEEEQK